MSCFFTIVEQKTLELVLRERRWNQEINQVPDNSFRRKNMPICGKYGTRLKNILTLFYIYIFQSDGFGKKSHWLQGSSKLLGKLIR